MRVTDEGGLILAGERLVEAMDGKVNAPGRRDVLQLRQQPRDALPNASIIGFTGTPIETTYWEYRTDRPAPTARPHQPGATPR